MSVGKRLLGPLFEPVPVAPSGPRKHYEFTSRKITGSAAPGAAKPTAKNTPLPAPGSSSTGGVSPRVQRSRLERWLMLSAVRDLLPDHRAASCHRIILSDKSNIDGVPVKFSARRNKSRFDNLNVCADVWCCPVCSLRIAFKRQETVEHILESHISSGGRAIMAVLTFRHHRDDNLRNIMNKFAAARQSMHRSREFRELRAKYGYVGNIRALEVTHSNNNGWHPHTHEIILVGSDWYLSRFDRFKSAYFKLWQKYASRKGLTALDVGFSFDLVSEDKASFKKISDYITRQISEHDFMTPDQEKEMELQASKNEARNGASASKELAFSVTKQASGESRTHMQILRDFAIDGDLYSGSLFQEFSDAFKGKRQLVFSDGLKAKYGVCDDNDSELAASADNDDVLLGFINREEWRAILRSNPRVRGNILRMCDSGSYEGVAAYIERVYLEYIDSRQ